MSTTTGVTFEVVGHPTPQGSKTKMPNGIYLEGRDAGQRARHKSWRAAVAKAARDVAHDDIGAPYDGPLVVEIEFRFPVPKVRARKVAASPHGSIPKLTSPDVDKLARSVLDGLTDGGLIVDDRLVVELTASKVEALGWTGATIAVQRWGA
jgi:crossover junction endodeoxyribonuclease RusA